MKNEATVNLQTIIDYKQQKIFTLNKKGLIYKFNEELFEGFTNMKRHPDKFERRWFSSYQYHKYGINTIFNKNHFEINFSAGLSVMTIKSGVEYTGEGWFYTVDVWYHLHDGREYNKYMTLNDFILILKRHSVKTQFSRI